MKGLLENMRDNKSVIENLTVYHKTLTNTGSYYVIRYYGKDLESVKFAAKYAAEAMDQMRSPTTTTPYMIGANWCVNLTYYGLD